MARHLPGLDAVRCLAVLAVCCSHALGVLYPGHATGVAAFLGGGGVQAFYALSGFLIGSILLEVAKAPSITAWWTFMARRWGRTLPTFWTVLVALAVLSWPGLDQFARTATLTHNLTSDAPMEWFAVSWSLAVEEVFYFLFGAVLLFASHLVGIRRAAWPCVVLFLFGPLAVRIWLVLSGTPAATHAALLGLDGIACGVAVAVLHSRHRAILDRLALVLGIAGLAMLWGAWHSYLSPQGAPAWMPWTPTLGAMGFSLFLPLALRVRSLGYLGRPIRAVAAASYPLYLVHLDALYGLQAMGLPGLIGRPLTLALWAAVTGLVVSALHRWIEVPGMRLRPRQASLASRKPC